jgi:aconitate hydratase
MAQNLLQKLVSARLVSGKAIPGEEIGLKVDQAFSNDATGPLAYLLFEGAGLARVQPETVVSYVDRGTYQLRGEESDEQRYLERAATAHGAFASRTGNGCAPIVHLERFAIPGRVILGADSQTPIAGAAGALAIGAGSVDLAAALAGGPFCLPMPRVVGVELVGQVPPWVTAFDIGLEILRVLTCRGGVGRVLEFHGEAVAALSVSDRATLAALAVETGAVSVLFPADGAVRKFLEMQARARHYEEWLADRGCSYDETLRIDLSGLEPLVARPGSPDAVVPVRELAGTPISQILAGSAASPGLADLRAISALTGDRGVNAGVSALYLPASRQALQAASKSGDLDRLLGAGWRILEPGSGPAIGVGMAPPSGGVSLRSATRNGKGRSGTADDHVYLAGPLVLAAAAISGELTDPRTLGIDSPRPGDLDRLPADDRLILPPGAPPDLDRGTRFRAIRAGEPIGQRLEGTVVGKVGDRVGVLDLLPATPETQAARTDMAVMASFALSGLDRTFASRCRAAGGGILVAGTDFGNGPGRDSAALALATLGVKAVVARDISRLFRLSLLSFGILPLMLEDADQLVDLEEGDFLELPDVRADIRSDEAFVLRNAGRDAQIWVRHGLTERQKDILLAGGLIPWAKRHALIPAAF